MSPFSCTLQSSDIHACYSLSKHLHFSLKCCLNAKQLLSSTWVMCLDSLLLSGCVRSSVCTRTSFWKGGQLTVFIFATYFWKQTRNDTTSRLITSPLCAANSSIGSHKDGARVGWRMIKQPGLRTLGCGVYCLRKNNNAPIATSKFFLWSPRVWYK